MTYLFQLAIEERIDVAAVVAVLLEGAEAVLDELGHEGLRSFLVEGGGGGRQVELHVLPLENKVIGDQCYMHYFGVLPTLTPQGSG